ncbi:hypothetical protein [Photobacterium leiognathi]|uniref:hypothetical protein n=1 Tax=Photobacterium leiognathi TaxID=553611 RepID=UPI00273955DE|nr:hypothetical protein [Photobacterium leiognathi]
MRWLAWNSLVIKISNIKNQPNLYDPNAKRLLKINSAAFFNMTELLWILEDLNPPNISIRLIKKILKLTDAKKPLRVNLAAFFNMAER